MTDDLNFEEAKSRHSALSQEIEGHNRRYYTLDEPTISDHEYDQLMLALQALESKYPELQTSDSPTQRVGSR